MIRKSVRRVLIFYVLKNSEQLVYFTLTGKVIFPILVAR